jgi:general secretion pathway protein C
MEKVLENPGTLSRSARVVPAVRDGQTRGYKLYGIRPGSIPKAIGLKNGDLLIEINNIELNSLDKAMDSYTKLRDAKLVELLIERRGKHHTLKLEGT